MIWFHRCRGAVAAALILIGTIGARPAFAGDVLVFAAASLRNALDNASHAYEKAGGATIRVSYAASSTLARQIESGAPADIFISADTKWMDDVAKHGDIQSGTRFNFLGNRLVLVAPVSNPVKVDIKPGFPLAKLLGNGHLAMADPAAVPAGIYGKAALENLGVWASVEGKIARAEDVRAALLYVERREAPFGIVYQTDAAADKGVRIAGYFPPGSYPTIIYPIALTASTKNPDAAKFLAFLHSAKAKPYFETQGFSVLD